ncbi:MAG TPA: hydantoinase/oxoprolinase family protein [Burkholderiaceae bacterium]|nr:hydantoinase/oxoprolinase family protein [Burkholderiaceae bacterium]
MNAARAETSVAVDVGGTFTDLVVYDGAGQVIRTSKVLTTPQDISAGIFESLREAGVELPTTAYLKHGTTTAINTVIERTGGKTALITTRGFRDVLELGRGNRPDSFDLFYRRLAPLVPRHLRFELGARLDGHGEELSPVDTGEIDEVLDACDREGVEAIAVCLLHAYRNPEHERQVGRHLRSRTSRFLSLSSDLSREWREHERTSTAALNAYVGPKMARYLGALQHRLDEAGFGGTLFLMESNGGVMTSDVASSRPACLLESGPVAGVVGAAVLSKRVGRAKAISFDMGGTTAKCALIDDGRVDVTTTYYVGGYGEGYPVQIPVIDIVEVGAGGGSIAHLDATGSLKVGPRSAGAEPGPACYGRGGADPTVTDANAALGRLPPAGLLGGAMKLDIDAARRVIHQKVAEPLGIADEAAAHGILTLAVVTMAAAVRRISIERGHDPRDFVLIVSGGAGPLHAAAIARELSIPTVLVPPLPGHFSAWGMLLADIRFDYAQTLVSALDSVDIGAIERGYRALEDEAATALRDAAPAVPSMTFSRFADMRYAGQEHTVRTPMPDDLTRGDVKSEIRRRFLQVYAQRYGHADEHGRLETVTLRVVADGIVDKPSEQSFAPLARVPGEPVAVQRSYFEETGWLECPIYLRESLPAGQRIAGPAIVADTGSTTVVGPSDSAEVDAHGNLLIAVALRGSAKSDESIGQ